MGKVIDRPRASLKAAFQLAEAVDSFAGSCSVALAAEKLGKKESGAFNAVIGAAGKYGLVDSKAGKLFVTPLYREYKLAYTPEDAKKIMVEALLHPPLFKGIAQRFNGQKLPLGHFEKMLIREFDVPDDVASRVAGYFLDGAKQAGLLNGEGVLTIDSAATEILPETSEDEAVTGLSSVLAPAFDTPAIPNTTVVTKSSEDFSIHINGPGINFSIVAKEPDDLEMVQIMLRKIEKSLKSSSI